jgi:hypothetical protein
MITLEQVKLLETKVARAVEYVERISRENFQLQGKLDSYQKRIEELEVLIQQFREDQGRIEEGILSALERLNRFEDAIEKSMAPESPSPPRRENRTERGRENRPAPAPASEPPEPELPSGPDSGEIEKLEPEGGEDPEDSPFEDESSQDGPASGELDIF